MRSEIRPAIVILILMTVITGVIYPLAITGIAQLVFPRQANGSLITRHGVVVGSSWIGQHFTADKYFWGRLSATTPPYNAAASSGSNLGPSNPTLVETARARISALRTADPDSGRPVPVDLVTASGSGLDPHISVAAADYQILRVAKARGMTPQQVSQLIAAHTSQRFLGVIGEPVVNVLELNLALDDLPGRM
jgi:K+-transporting ATPase ATPase C chain